MAVVMPFYPTPVLAARRRQSGAFDLPSVLVGVAVVAILAVGVMAAVFGVIPWTQDRAAQEDLAAVNAAQGAAYARDGDFAGKAALVGAGWLGEDTPDELQTEGDGKCYVAVTTSRTGDRFIVSDDHPSPRPLENSDRWCTGALVIVDPDPLMLSTWDSSISAGCREITLPITGFKGTVNWGDGATDTKLTHAYANAGEVRIRINGTFDGWGGYRWADAGCLLSVDRWGATETTSLRYAFHDADSLVHVESIPSSTTDLTAAFRDVGTDFTLGSLDTYNVTTMESTFGNAKEFDQPVNFSTAKVTNMHGMFDGAAAFNKPLKLNTSNVTDMQSMLSGAVEFNRPLELDTSSVTTMSGMFDHADAFNQPITFDTSRVTDMSYMFANTDGFNQALSFDTSRTTNMYGMFWKATAFNQALTFDTSKVTTMYGMFFGTQRFNQPLAFDTSRVNEMSNMFAGASAFNQDLSAWNVSLGPKRDVFSDGALAWKLPKPKWVA